MRIVKYVLWRLPIKIWKSWISLLNMETSPNTETMAKRGRPLHTLGSSILAIGNNALTKARDFDEPLGSMAKRAVSFFDSFFPFIYSMLYQWLAMLAFMDDHILTVEHAVEFVFPPSKRLFDKMDVFVRDAEVLPEKVDYILGRVSKTMHKFPFLDWVFGLLVQWLHFLVSILNLWVTSEREMRFGASCNSFEEKEACSVQEKANTWRKVRESSNSKDSQEIETSIKRLEFYDVAQLDENSPMFMSAVSSPFPDFSGEGSDAFGTEGMSKPKCTYKEVLESGDKGRC